MTEHAAEVEQAHNERAAGQRLGNADAVRAAEKRLAAHGAKPHDDAKATEQRKAKPVEAKPTSARQSQR